MYISPPPTLPNKKLFVVLCMNAPQWWNCTLFFEKDEIVDLELKSLPNKKFGHLVKKDWVKWDFKRRNYGDQSILPSISRRIVLEVLLAADARRLGRRGSIRRSPNTEKIFQILYVDRIKKGKYLRELKRNQVILHHKSGLSIYACASSGY